jgi:hypothetical protein
MSSQTKAMLSREIVRITGIKKVASRQPVRITLPIKSTFIIHL